MTILKTRKIVNQNRIIWFKGNLIKAKDAKVGILSPTAQFGLNVFEGIRCFVDSVLIFKSTVGIARLNLSCVALCIFVVAS